MPQAQHNGLVDNLTVGSTVRKMYIRPFGTCGTMGKEDFFYSSHDSSEIATVSKHHLFLGGTLAQAALTNPDLQKWFAW